MPDQLPDQRLNADQYADSAPLNQRAPTLDRAALDANTMSDPALQKELFELYFGHAPSSLQKMADALRNADPAGWTEGAHALKGTASTLGLMRLADAAAAAEAAGRAGPTGLTEKRFAAVRDALTASIAAAQSYLAQAASAA